MWVLLRPGPYVCAEWDFGGIPPYLLKDPELKVRSLYPRYMQAAERYMAQLARVVTPLLVTHGGPIVHAAGRKRVRQLRQRSRLHDCGCATSGQRAASTCRSSRATGRRHYMLEAGQPAGRGGRSRFRIERAALGTGALDRAGRAGVFVRDVSRLADALGRAVGSASAPNLIKEVTFLLANKKSFNFYVAHGGTNFGFTAGANSGGKGGYEPDVTSYDYDAPINEQGRATPKYHALRDLIASYLPTGRTLPPVPDPIPAIAIPEFPMTPLTSIWDHLPAADRLRAVRGRSRCTARTRGWCCTARRSSAERAAVS